MVNYIYIDADGHKRARRVTNREDYLTLRNTPDNCRHFAQGRAGDEKEKAKQTQFNYNDLLPDGVLKGCCHPSSTFSHDIDCGDEKECKRIATQLLEMREEIGLLELSVSARWGLHAICRRESQKTILENMVRVSTLTQTEMDTAPKDLQRILYVGPADAETLLFLDDAIFEETLTVEESEKEFELLKERERRGEEDVPPGAKKANKHYRPWDDCSLGSGPEVKFSVAEGSAGVRPESEKVATATLLSRQTQGLRQTQEQDRQTQDSQSQYPKDYHGIPFEVILKKYWELNNKGFEPTEGDRDTLTYQLASDLRHICGRNAQWLDQVIPCYDGFPLEEKRAKIANALSSKYEGMPQRLRIVLDELEGNDNKGAANSVTLQTPSGNEPPEMPEKLPKLIALLVSRTPKVYRAAVANAVFPSLAAHLWQVRFNYTDNVEHEATLMNILMAGTGAGKDCISQPIDHIMADIRRRDEENLAREKAWKDDQNSKGANKDKQKRPEGLVIQEIDADMTNPAFVMRTDEAEGHFLYTKLNEIDQFDALRGNGRGGQQFQIMCLAFDPNNRYGQTRVGTQSVTAKVQIRFNWNAATTILKGQRYFRNVLTDGPISRINFCTIPEREIGAEQPVYGKYDSDFDEELRPYIENLTKARGLIECQPAFRLAKKLQAECADFARLSQSRVYENLSFRANVIAWLKGCVLYVASGCAWDKKTFEPFIRWSLNYDLWCKMSFFGEAIEQAQMKGEGTNRKGPANLLEQLPDIFTVEDVIKVRRQQGLGAEGTMQMLYQWKYRKYITPNSITPNSYQKLRKK